MSINKKFLSSVAAIMILVYHVWTTISSSNVSTYIVMTLYAGVDIFFFLSAYSLAGKDVKYGSFILNRFIKIYTKFIVFAVIFAIYKHMSFVDFLMTITGIALFTKGGGSFLWFGPAIMIFYLVYPLFNKWNFKFKGLIVLAVWAVVGVLLTYLTSYRAIFIFWNRLPIILVGYYAKMIKFKIPNWTGFIILPIGCVILYFLGAKYQFQDPIAEIFYLSPIVFVIGIAILSNYVPKNIVTNVLSSFTFELYGVQAIFAYSLTDALFGVIDLEIVVNLLAMAILLVGGYLFYLAWKYSEIGICKLIDKIKNKNQIVEE